MGAICLTATHLPAFDAHDRLSGGGRGRARCEDDGDNDDNDDIMKEKNNGRKRGKLS